MAILTPEQITSFRANCGAVVLDNANAEESEINDGQIQALYDKALTFGQDVDRTEARTCVYILRWLLGQARVKVDIGGTQERAESRSQFFKNLSSLLAYYEQLAGMLGGTLQVGTFDLNIDYNEADMEAGA